MTRQEHLDWAKKRAIEYVDEGDLSEALASMVSDLGKHSELYDHPARSMMVGMYSGGLLNSQAAMRDFIEGFN